MYNIDPKTLRRAADRTATPPAPAAAPVISRREILTKEKVSHNGCLPIKEEWGTRYESYEAFFESYSFVTNAGSRTAQFRPVGSNCHIVCLGGKGTLVAGYRFDLTLGVEVQIEEHEVFYIQSETPVTFRIVMNSGSTIEAINDDVIPGTEAPEESDTPSGVSALKNEKVLLALQAEQAAHERKINTASPGISDKLRIL